MIEIKNETSANQKTILAIPAAAAAMPVNPKIPAMTATIKSEIINLNIIFLLGVVHRKYQYSCILHFFV